MSGTQVLFEVERIFKGEVGKNEQIAFTADNCVSRSFRIGDRFLVYADSNRRVGQCNRTYEIGAIASDVEVVSEMAENPTMFLVAGRVFGVEAKDWEGVNISVVDGKKRLEQKADQGRAFYQKFFSSGDFKIEVSVPFSAQFRATSYPIEHDLTVFHGPKQYLASYKAKYVPGTCDYRDITVARTK